MHGLGNDFLVLDAAAARGLSLTAAQWRALADRHRGIGFDQALVLEPPHRADTLAFYRIYNADGLEVEQCGNGVRCLAELLRRRRTRQGRLRWPAATGEPCGSGQGAVARARRGGGGHGRTGFLPGCGCLRCGRPARSALLAACAPAAGGIRHRLDGKSARGDRRARRGHCRGGRALAPRWNHIRALRAG